MRGAWISIPFRGSEHRVMHVVACKANNHLDRHLIVVSKRPGDLLDSPLPKQMNTGMDSDPLEMVGEDELPDAQTIANLNARIHSNITAPPAPELLSEWVYLCIVLTVVQTQCGFVPLTSADQQWVRANTVQLGGMVQEAHRKADYSALMRLSTSLLERCRSPFWHAQLYHCARVRA